MLSTSLAVAAQPRQDYLNSPQYSTASSQSPELKPSNSGNTGVVRTAIITLITGDVLTVTELQGGKYAISTTPNRAFRTITTRNDTYVIPVGLAGVGQTIDPKLFDIAYLMRNGY